MKKIFILLILFTFIFPKSYPINPPGSNTVEKLNNAGEALIKAKKAYYWGWFLTTILPSTVALADKELFEDNVGELIVLQLIGSFITFTAFAHVGNAGEELKSITKDVK